MTCGCWNLGRYYTAVGENWQREGNIKEEIERVGRSRTTSEGPK